MSQGPIIQPTFVGQQTTSSGWTSWWKWASMPHLSGVISVQGMALGVPVVPEEKSTLVTCSGSPTKPAHVSPDGEEVVPGHVSLSRAARSRGRRPGARPRAPRRPREPSGTARSPVPPAGRRARVTTARAPAISRRFASSAAREAVGDRHHPAPGADRAEVGRDALRGHRHVERHRVARREPARPAARRRSGRPAPRAGRRSGSRRRRSPHARRGWRPCDGSAVKQLRVMSSRAPGSHRGFSTPSARSRMRSGGASKTIPRRARVRRPERVAVVDRPAVERGDVLDPQLPHERPEVRAVPGRVVGPPGDRRGVDGRARPVGREEGLPVPRERGTLPCADRLHEPAPDVLTHGVSRGRIIPHGPARSRGRRGRDGLDQRTSGRSSLGKRPFMSPSQGSR